MCGPHRIIHPQGQGKDGTQIDFMCVTMIDQAIIWFEIVDLLASKLLPQDIPMDTKGRKGTNTHKQNKQPNSSYTNKLDLILQIPNV
jgi:hypothetical protein